MQGSANATIINNRITGNTTANQSNGHGIGAGGASHATIRDNTISGNDRRGLSLFGGAQITISNNTISNNLENGILIGGSDVANESVQVDISSNTIQSNKSCGVNVDSDSGIKITGKSNTISGNTKGQLCGTTNKFPAGFGGGK